MALGDGGSGLPAQRRLADQLIKHHEQCPFSMVLLLGDNIYPNGDTIRYGEKRFTVLYRELMDRGVRFFPILGNHDISGPLGVGYPALWMSNQAENMRFFKMPSPYYDLACGPFHFFMLNTNRFKSKQRLWLNECMSASDRPFKIVCGHHPIFSSGFHGGSTRLRKRLKPIIEKAAATAYFSAHEHDYERFKPINQILYLVSGGGGADLRPFRRPQPSDSVVRKSIHHFLSCELTPDAFTIAAIDEAGVAFDSVTLPVPDESSYLSAFKSKAEMFA